MTILPTAEDRRPALIGFGLLLLMMSAHAMMETARDVLFLSHVPATQLPWAYLSIAALALLTVRANQRLLARFADRQKVLAASLIGAATIDVGLWWWLGGHHGTARFVFYVWTGLVSTVVVVQFWLLLDEMVTVTQAKRLFGLIAAGGVVGASVGAMISERIVLYFEPRHLALGAAGTLLVAAMVPLCVAHPEHEPEPAPPALRTSAQGWPTLLRQPYLRRLLGLVLASTLVFTGVDYVFKSEVAAQVAPNDLPLFFARFYVGLNLAALVVQLFAASWLLRVCGVNATLMMLPALLLAGLVGVVLVPTLLTLMLLKGADGSLRHSLHRTGTEVLYLPLPTDLRDRFKALIDVIGQRGGQAIASLLILGSVALGATTTHLIIAVSGLVVCWMFILVGLKKPYLDLFRASLRGGGITKTGSLEKLDLHSLEALMRALNSEQDAEVLSAVDLFEQHGKVHLVPTLILYHPSKDVTLRALDAFARQMDPNFIPIARRLLKTPHCEVRAGALRALTTVAPDPELLRQYLDDEFPIVRATALVGLLSTPTESQETLEARLNEEVAHGSDATREQLARAIAQHRHRRFVPALLTLLAASKKVETQIEVIRAMSAIPDPRFLQPLLPLLGNGMVRPTVRRAMLAIGGQAVEFLDEALDNSALPRKVRRHIPRTLSRFAPRQAVPILMKHLVAPHEGAVRFKILRGLGRIRADHPELKLDREVLFRFFHETLERTIRMLDWHVATEQSGRANTPGGELLLATLKEKEMNALERLFRLLGLLYPKEDFKRLWEGVRSSNRKTRAAGRELLEHTLESPVREAVIALVGNESDAVRLSRASSALRNSSSRPDYESRLVSMLEDRSEAVRCIAAHHIGELGIPALVDDLERNKPKVSSLVNEVIDRAIETLNRATKAPEPAPGSHRWAR